MQSIISELFGKYPILNKMPIEIDEMCLACCGLLTDE